MIRKGSLRFMGPCWHDVGMNPDPRGNPDRVRWNARYAGDFIPSFEPHPLAARALSLDLPAGPVLDLACGASGSVLLAAETGRSAIGVDVSDEALGLLEAEIRRRGVIDRVGLVQADLTAWRPPASAFAVVLCTGYWDSELFPFAAGSVAPGGLLGWEALTTDVLKVRPGLSANWCLGAGEPASLLPVLPEGWEVISQEDLPQRSRRQLLARRG
jgi:SAM-dependent methyltransferase